MSYIARPPNYSKLFAFYNREIVISHVQQYNGWEVYSPMKEYDRLGLTSVNGWRVTNVNREFSICPSYPSSFIVPEAIDDDTLSKVPLVILVIIIIIIISSLLLSLLILYYYYKKIVISKIKELIDDGDGGDDHRWRSFE